MDLIYLDYNCFQRGFDDHRQIRIQMEALACQEIFSMSGQSRIRLVWSFMHQDESFICPFPLRKQEAMNLSVLCKVKIGPKEDIIQTALSFQHTANVSAKDSLHLACAVFAHANYFLTCDDELIKRAKRIKLKIIIMNPVDYIRKVKK